MDTKKLFRNIFGLLTLYPFSKHHKKGISQPNRPTPFFVNNFQLLFGNNSADDRRLDTYLVHLFRLQYDRNCCTAICNHHLWRKPIFGLHFQLIYGSVLHVLFNSCNHFKFCSNLRKSFFTCLFRKICIHISPFIIFTSCCILQIFQS